MFLRYSCLLCGAVVSEHDWLCGACNDDLPRPQHSCQYCGIGVAAKVIACGRCSVIGPAWVDRVVTAFEYAYPVDEIIKRFKYQQRLSLAMLLGAELAARAAQRRGELPEVLVPVPLHWRRVVERGYNQAHELGRAVGRQLGIPITARLAKRHRRTAAQVGQGARARRQNLKGAFRITGDVTKKRIAVVDDVYTTGATVQELARALKRAGAASVEAWVVAHAGGR